MDGADGWGIAQHRLRYRDLKFITSKRIVHAYNTNSFYGLIITGPQGIGKSVYALKIMLEIYGSWRECLRNLIFSIDDLIDVFERREKIPVVLWDDAGIHGFKYLSIYNRRLTQLIQSYIDVVRTKISGFLITVPSIDELVRPLRFSPGFNLCRISRADKETARHATVYGRIILPTRLMWKKIYEDRFNCILDDEYYREYMEIRKTFYEEAEEKLKKYIKHLRKQEADKYDSMEED